SGLGGTLRFAHPTLLAMTSVRIPATRSARVMLRSPSKIQRAQGRPDAALTRVPCAQTKYTVNTQATHVQPTQAGTPRTMHLRLIRDLLGAPGCLAAVALRIARKA